MSPADVLNQAADLIERDGWWNGKGEVPEDGPACALMAINGVCRRAEDPFEVASNAMRKFIGNSQLANWNDAQPDGATVCAALRACARSL
jgi:hypothetical protein